MSKVVSRLNGEFTAEIRRIQDENPHDTLELSSSESISASQWREILVVYAVKAAADPENGMEVATLDDTKVGILRDVFWDMNKIDYWIETIEHEETVTTTDEDGNETTETITTTETILHINITSRSHTDMIAEYGFNPDQVKMLNELMQDEYQELFMQLTGS
jgi:vacuolar-type H+-ATPase subunit I/STV1